MVRLIIKESPSKNRTYSLDKKKVTIGRSPQCDVHIDQTTISRTHAVIEKKGDLFHIMDLESTNGTYVNGMVTNNTALKNQDVIRIGNVQIIYDENIVEDISVSSDAPLAVLQQVGKAINKIMSEEDLLNLVMDMVFSIFEADRGLIFLVDRNTQELVPRFVKGGKNKGEKIVTSKSLIETVLKNKVGLIVFDTMSDPRFMNQESIIGSNIGSVMAVPMLIRDEVIGLIQVDSKKGGKNFSKEELNLLCSMSDYLAIGIEQARLTELMKKETRIRANLERFHSPAVVNKIVSQLDNQEDIGLEVEEKEASILFADICDFTSMAEKLNPVEVTALLNEYFTLMTDIIFEYGGTLDKYIGDAVMALFGVPYSHDEHADRMVLAAKKMQEKTRQFSENAKPSHKIALKIGINTGRVVAGNMGSQKRMEYTVLGDAVNVAARLCGLCSPGQVLMGNRTRELLREDFNIREVGMREVKGRQQKVHIHELQI